MGSQRDQEFDAACTLCSELAGLETNNLFRSLVASDEFSDRIVAETEHFVVMPSLGQIVEGYTIIVTKKHYPSLGHIPIEHDGELAAIMARTVVALEKAYKSTPFLFEHGPTATDMGAACVDHAHLHFVPLSRTTISEVVEGLEGEKASGIAEARRYIAESRPYILYGLMGEMFITDAVSLPSQFLRFKIAKSLGELYKMSWKEYIGEEEVVRTLRKIKSVTI